MSEGERMFKVASDAGVRLAERIIFSKKNEGVGFGNKEASHKEWLQRFQSDATFRESQKAKLGEDRVRRLLLGKD